MPQHGQRRQHDLLSLAAGEGRALLRAAEGAWSRPIPHCPGWDAAQLVEHTGSILAWIATIATTGQPVSRDDRERAPTDPSRLSDWYSTHLARTVDILASTDPEARVWTFSSRGERRAGWWRRRLAVELSIHRWDAQDAQHATGLDSSGAPAALDGEVAAAGIEEFVTEFLPGMLANGVCGLEGTLHLHGTDGSSEWHLDLGERADLLAVPGHAKADTAIRGTRSDLLLWLTNRDPAAALEVFGRADLLRDWRQLRR